MPRSQVTVSLDGFAHGGDAVGRLPGGKVCFVSYAIPGETVVAELTEDRRRFARATAVEVLEPSPHRTTPPCPHFGAGECGGCRLQHISTEHQAELLRRVVVEQLQRIGKVTDPPVAPTVRPHSEDGLAYRNRARMRPDGQGRLGLRRAGSASIKPIPACPLLEPAAQAAREDAGDALGGVSEVVVRGDADGGRMLEIFPGSAGLPPLPDTDTPVALVGADGPVALRGETVLTERVAGRSLQVSATSFFQASRAAAEVLVALVIEAADIAPGDEVLDLYAGVGLFSVALASQDAHVTAVEGHPSAAADARANLRALEADVLDQPVDEAVADRAATGRQADVVVLDPPRQGAGQALSRALGGLARRTIVYVACDPAALARDVAVLSEHGWHLQNVVPVDQFTHTAHVEVVATLGRTRRQPPGGQG